MEFLKGKTAIITGGGKAEPLKDGSAGSIGYGIAIAYMQGILHRSTAMFPDIAAELK